MTRRRGKPSAEGLPARPPLSPAGARLNAPAWAGALALSREPTVLAQGLASGHTATWLEPVLDATGPGQTVLELGCGTGLMSAGLAMRGREVSLLDWSGEVLAFARRVLQAASLDAKLVRADVLDGLPLASGTYDCVWSSGLLEHFTDGEIEHVLAESARVSRGTVLALVPNRSCLPYQLGKWYQQRTDTWSWGTEYPKGSLSRHFARAGLEVVMERSIDPWFALRFLTMPGSLYARRAVELAYRLLPTRVLGSLNQGYLLATVGRKRGGP